MVSPLIPDSRIRERVIFALDRDFDHPQEYEQLFQTLKPEVPAIKIGYQAFTRWGLDVVHAAKNQGFRIFLDLKFFDIPNTVAQAAENMVALGVWMFTLHAEGGAEMMQRCREAVEQKSQKLQMVKPLIMGVTVLTSQTAKVEVVLERAQKAKQHGCDGIICSAWEAQSIRQLCGPDFLIVTPGIRFQDEGSAPLANPKKTDDQVRIATPKKALDLGADYLVMGRPLLQLLEKRGLPSQPLP